jgi:hypothetical protein
VIQGLLDFGGEHLVVRMVKSAGLAKTCRLMLIAGDAPFLADHIKKVFAPVRNEESH